MENYLIHKHIFFQEPYDILPVIRTINIPTYEEMSLINYVHQR